MTRPLRVMYVLNSPIGGATLCITDLLQKLPRESYTPFLVLPSFPTEQRLGFLRSLCADLRVVPMGWWNWETGASVFKQLLIAGLENARTAGYIRPVRQLQKCIREWNIDLVHTNTGSVPWGALAARLCGVRHVWHIHEPNGREGPFQHWLPDRLLAQIIVSLSDQVILVSRYVGEVFQCYGLEAKTRVVYQGVNVSAFSANVAGQQLRRVLQVEDN